MRARTRTKDPERFYFEERREDGSFYHRWKEAPSPAEALENVCGHMARDPWPSTIVDGVRRPDLRPEHSMHLMKVTRYRLAPLIELPPWRPGKPSDPWPERAMVVESGAHGVYAWVDVDGWGIGDDPYWGDAEILGEGDAKDIDEARAACESRLRELGYRVARAKAKAKRQPPRDDRDDDLDDFTHRSTGGTDSVAE